MATWFTADLHFGHRNIIDYCNRPFRDVDAMNESLIENWNESIAADDTVWVVGDFALGKIADTLGSERVVCIAKELTKLHETFWVGSAAEVRDALARASRKGEFVVMIAPASFTL